jgi:hypothetical protein
MESSQKSAKSAEVRKCEKCESTKSTQEAHKVRTKYARFERDYTQPYPLGFFTPAIFVTVTKLNQCDSHERQNAAGWHRINAATD